MGDPGAGGLLEEGNVSTDGGTIALAERLLQVLEYGHFSATYKYALATAILDLSFEQTSAKGEPPTTLTTRQLAEKVTALYWPHASPFEKGTILRQGGVRAGQQAEILRHVADFKGRFAGSEREWLERARAADPAAFERLLRRVEWKLIEMPIPRMQRVGRTEDRFLYEYGWTEEVSPRVVTAYQEGDRSAFDNRLLLKPGAGEALVRLNGVLRPILQREWAVMIAGMNGLPDARLEEFLFGADRVSLAAVRGPLRELQSGRCFYCNGALRSESDVDHFIPWARYPENGLDNLVVAHPACNHAKRDFFASADHVESWAKRLKVADADLATIASRLGWDRAPSRTRSVATAMYSRLPDDARLWQAKDLFVAIEGARIRRALAEAA